MRKFSTIIAAAAILAAGTAASHAFDYNIGLGAGVSIGGTANLSGAGGLAGTTMGGGGWAEASNEAYGISEGSFQGNYNGNNGTFQLNGTNMAASGSLSNASVTSSGNGFAAAGSIGAGFGAGFSGGLAGAGGVNAGN